MNEFDYSTYDDTNNDIAFDSVKGYVDPASELETRKQLSYPLKELKTYINNSTPKDTDGNKVQLTVSSTSIGYSTTPNATPTPIVVPGLVPSGGDSGKVLKKASNSDYDMEWGTPDGVTMGDPIYTGSQTSSTSQVVVNLPQNWSSSSKFYIAVLRYSTTVDRKEAVVFLGNSDYTNTLQIGDKYRKFTISGKVLTIGDCPDGSNYCIPVRIYGVR